VSLLVPGYERLAEEERARQAAVHRIDCLPWSPALAAGPIHVLSTAVDAEAWAERLHGEPVSELGTDTEFAFARPPVVLRNGKTVDDLSSLRPLVCSVAAWCGAALGGGDHLIRLLFDLRRPEVYPALRTALGLHVPWVAHSARAEYHCLWACGVEPQEHLLLDTHVTASCLNLGRFHRRRRAAGAEEEVARARKLAEKAAHITSLVGQCEHYGIEYPYSKSTKDDLRARFARLRPDDPIDVAMAAYAMSDAEYALRLHLAQTPDVQRLGLLPHLAAVEWPLVGTLARMEQVGLPVNPARMQEYRQLCRTIAGAMARRLEPFDIKPGSWESFLDAMEKAGALAQFLRHGKRSTEDDVLREAERRGVHPAVKPFRLHRYFARMANDDVLTGRPLGADGRLRCSLDQLGCASGRIISSKPNLIGMDGRLRPIVEAPQVNSADAPDGWVLIELDYSQEEVGLAGAEWDDEELVRQFNLGDSYAGVAQVFYADGLSPEERALPPAEFARRRKDLRKRVKDLVLGMLFGKRAPAIAEKFGCSLAHAEAELKRFFDTFPQARDNAAAAVRRSLRRGYGLTVTGLRRFIDPGDDRFENAMRNHPIQGSASAIFKTALVRIDRHFRGTPTHLLLPRHDSILLLTPKGSEHEVIAVCRTLMVQALREKYPRLRPRIDAKVSTTWPTELTLEDYYRTECGEDQNLATAAPRQQLSALPV
jgi:DNA polymerase I-like protein with 3'-5' exonuclease and polymerase domains